jgi:hypothetical protein
MAREKHTLVFIYVEQDEMEFLFHGNFGNILGSHLRLIHYLHGPVDFVDSLLLR